MFGIEEIKIDTVPGLARMEYPVKDGNRIIDITGPLASGKSTYINTLFCILSANTCLSGKYAYKDAVVVRNGRTFSICNGSSYDKHTDKDGTVVTKLNTNIFAIIYENGIPVKSEYIRSKRSRHDIDEDMFSDIRCVMLNPDVLWYYKHAMRVFSEDSEEAAVLTDIMNKFNLGEGNRFMVSGFTPGIMHASGEFVENEYFSTTEKFLFELFYDIIRSSSLKNPTLFFYDDFLDRWPRELIDTELNKLLIKCNSYLIRTLF